MSLRPSADLLCVFPFFCVLVCELNGRPFVVFICVVFLLVAKCFAPSFICQRFDADGNYPFVGCHCPLSRSEVGKCDFYYFLTDVYINFVLKRRVRVHYHNMSRTTLYYVRDHYLELCMYVSNHHTC